MRRFLEAQRLIVILIAASIVGALAIGLWPVKANVFGDASYSCGSGFLHSAHTWSVDSQIVAVRPHRRRDRDRHPVGGVPEQGLQPPRLRRCSSSRSASPSRLIAQITLERPEARARGHQSIDVHQSPGRHGPTAAAPRARLRRVDRPVAARPRVRVARGAAATSAPSPVPASGTRRTRATSRRSRTTPLGHDGVATSPALCSARNRAASTPGMNT